MHHALELDEILLNIFTRCNPPPSESAADLVALATTCRAFKESALDILWSELNDLTPLARCLSDVSSPMCGDYDFEEVIFYQDTGRCKATMLYSFKRPLTQVEWDTLRNYTRRVRSVHDSGKGLRDSCIITLLTPPTPDPLFPNLQHLDYTFTGETEGTLMWHQPLPSLMSLHCRFKTKGRIQDPLSCFPTFSPNLKKILIDLPVPNTILDQIISDYIRRWSDPQVVCCPQITLDLDALEHLSHVPGLTQLTFTPSATSPDEIASSGTRLLFTTLKKLKLLSTSLVTISQLLAHIHLPAITDFSVEISPPSKRIFASFATMLQTSGIHNALTSLILDQNRGDALIPVSVLSADYLQPSTAFRNLRHIELNLKCKVVLTDDDLLALAPAWPDLERLLINEKWGWRTPGITPDGLTRLLETCPSLSDIALAIDTRHLTEVPPLRPPPATLGQGSHPPPLFSINVIDSNIEDASVPAMAAFLANIVPSIQYSITLSRIREDPSWMMRRRWRDVRTRTEKAIAQRFRVLG